MEKLPCPKCGTGFDPDWAFCQECGLEIDEATLKAALPHCPDCGKTIRSGEQLDEREFGRAQVMYLCPHCRAILGVRGRG